MRKNKGPRLVAPPPVARGRASEPPEGLEPSTGRSFSEPARHQKGRKAAALHQSEAWLWPYAYEDVDEIWALEAIDHGNGSILARYLREVEEIEPRVRRAFAEVLSPTSNHVWRLHPQYRFRGKPSKRATTFKPGFVAALAPLIMHISGTMTINATIRRSLANMLDPESRHPLHLEFRRRRKRGRPPLVIPRPDSWSLVPTKMETDMATRLVRREVASGDKLLSIETKLRNRMSRATLYRRLKALGISRKPKKQMELPQG